MPEKNNKLRQLAFVAILGALAIARPAGAVTVDSPNGRIAMDVSIGPRGVPVYSVQLDDEPIIADAQLGMRFAGRPDLDSGFEISGTIRDRFDEIWEQPWGERRYVRNHYNELLVIFTTTDEPVRQFNLQVRVFDDGIGFRYIVPEQDAYDQVSIVDELTEFRLPLDATAFWIPGYAWNRHEFIYQQTPVTDVALANTPMTVRLPSGAHISLHEAALVDYAGYVLDQRRDGSLQDQPHAVV